MVTADDDACDILLDAGETEHVTYDDIVQARTVFEWTGQPKSGKPKHCRKKEVARS